MPDNPPETKPELDRLKAALVKVSRGRDPESLANRIWIPTTEKGKASRKRQAVDPTFKGPGGWKGHPNSLAALAANRERGYLQNQRKCAKCGNVAMRHSDLCRHHAPAQHAALRAKDPMYRPRKSSLMKAEVHKLIRANAIPLELARQPAFQTVMKQALAPWTELSGHVGGRYTSVGKFRRACWVLVAELIQAWITYVEHGDVQPWVGVIAKGKALGLLD